MSLLNHESRMEFKQLIADCNAGKIDLVLVKSISRFARDTVDCLHTVRRLKEKGIAVRFERENIDSMSEDGDVQCVKMIQKLSLPHAVKPQSARAFRDFPVWKPVDF